MTDLEMTRLCAEAMGIESDSYVLLMHSDGTQAGPFLDQPDADVYDPLHNDAQAMDLAKKLYLGTMPPFGIGETWQVTECTGKFYGNSDNLNRAIVECVAKMQASK